MNPLSRFIPLRRSMWRLANRFDGAALRYAFLKETMAHVRRSPDEIAARQLDALKRTLCLAKATVPYWRDTFRQIGFNPETIRSTRALEALPITTKALIREQGDRMLSERFDKRHLIPRTTGGSSGEPLRFYVDRPSLERQMAVNLRTFTLAGLPDGEKVVKIWGYKSSLAAQNRFRHLSGRAFVSGFDTSDDAFRQWTMLIRGFRPRGIYGYAGAIAHFARYINDRSIDLPPVPVVMTTAETLFPEMRDAIRRAFHGTVIDTYGAHECIRIATQCAHGTLHLQPDAAVVEFQETDTPNDRPLLLTTLHADAMPFIRYDLGDRGAPSTAPCPCGLPFPAMTMTHGKVHRIFQLPDRTIHTTQLHQPLYRASAIAKFQIRHTARHHIDIAAVFRPGADEAAHREVDTIVTRLSAIAGSATTVNLRRVDRIPTTARGKHQPILTDVPEDR